MGSRQVEATGTPDSESRNAPISSDIRFSYLRALMDSFRAAITNYPTALGGREISALHMVMDVYENDSYADQRPLFDSYLAMLNAVIGKLNLTLTSDEAHPYLLKFLGQLNSSKAYLALMSGEPFYIETELNGMDDRINNGTYLKRFPDKANTFVSNTLFVAKAVGTESGKRGYEIQLQRQPQGEQILT